jgi:hypothetical protein
MHVLHVLLLLFGVIINQRFTFSSQRWAARQQKGHQLSERCSQASQQPMMMSV